MNRVDVKTHGLCSVASTQSQYITFNESQMFTQSLTQCRSKVTLEMTLQHAAVFNTHDGVELCNSNTLLLMNIQRLITGTVK